MVNYSHPGLSEGCSCFFLSHRKEMGADAVSPLWTVTLEAHCATLCCTLYRQSSPWTQISNHLIGFLALGQ